MKNRKIIIIIVLLLVLLAIIFWLRKKPVEAVIPNFTLQGETVLSEGEFEMKIWDNNTEDGDTVAVYFNNKKLVDTLGILYEPVKIKLGKLKKGTYLLGVSAINEGVTAPASCSVSLFDGKEEKEFTMDAWVDSAASWKVIVQ